MSYSTTAADERIPAAVWRLAGVVVFGAFMSTLDTSLVNIGIDTIGLDLHAGLDTVQWIASGYLLAMAVALPTCGWLTRRFGASRVWLYSMIGFTVTSLLCAVAPNIGWLIVFRVLQGLTSGLLVPSGQTIIGRAAGPQRLGRVMGTLGMAIIVAPALGPTVGGIIIQYVSWQWLFLINLPLGALAIILGIRVLPRDSGTRTEPLDLPGLAVLAVSLPAILYALTEAGTTGGVTSVRVWLPAIIGILAAALFPLTLHRARVPAVNVRLLRRTRFGAATLGTFCSGAVLFGLMLLLPLYFQGLYHYSVITTGLSMVGFGIGGIIAMRIGGILTDRIGGGVVALCGALLIALCVVPFVVYGNTDTVPPIALVQVLLVIIGGALGLAAMPLISVAYASVSHDQLPDATALVNIAQRLGGAISGALVAVTVHKLGATHSPAATFGWTFAWPLGFAVIAAAVTLVVIRVTKVDRQS